MKNIQDQQLKFWIQFFIDKNSNCSISHSIKGPLLNIMNELKNSQNLYSKEQIYPKGNINDPKNHLISLFHLSDPISNEEYNFFYFFQDNYTLFKENFEKIQPFFIRGMIHYFYLLEHTFKAVLESDDLNSNINLSILDDKYTNSFLQNYLFLKNVSNLSDFFDPIFFQYYPSCKIKDVNSFSSNNKVYLKLRSFDSATFRQIIEYTIDISVFQLAENYFLLLMNNIDNLNYSEFNNINEFCLTITHKYINSFFKILPNGQNEIIDNFFGLIDKLEIGKKEMKQITSLQTGNENNDEHKISTLFDYKFNYIIKILNTIIQIIKNIELCKNHLINSNFFQYLIHFTIWAFSNSDFLHILIKKDLNAPDLTTNDKKNQVVKLISTYDDLIQSANQNINEPSDDKKIQYLSIPEEVNQMHKLFHYLAKIPKNNEFIKHLFKEIITFVNSLNNAKKETQLQDLKKQFNITNSDDDYVDIDSFKVTSILIFCEIIQNCDEKELPLILPNFEQLNFLFNDYLFERTEENNNSDKILFDICIKKNSRFLTYVRNSLTMALLKLSHKFFPQIVDVFSKLIIGSNLSICDYVISFLIQLMNENKSLFSVLDMTNYILPFISYGTALTSNLPETKRFYILLNDLLQISKIFNDFYENQLFANFIFLKIYDSNFYGSVISCLTSLEHITSPKANTNIIEHILVDSFKLLIKTIEENGEKSNEINQSIIQIIQLFQYHFYFHKNSIKIAIEKTNLIKYIDQSLNTIQTNEHFLTIAQLIYSLQYYSETGQIISECVNQNRCLISIFQKDYSIFSKLELNSNLRKIVGTLVFGNRYKGMTEPHRKVMPIQSIEPLWMVHNILKFHLEMYSKYFEYIDLVIGGLFCNQILLSDSTFLQNCLNFICRDKSNESEESPLVLAIFKKIVSHVLIWEFPSNLFLTYDKINFLNILNNCVKKESYDFPANFACLSLFDNSKGITFGPYSKFSYSFTVTFSFRYESIFGDGENFEYFIFNDRDNKFSIRISKEKTLKFYEKDSVIPCDDFAVSEKEWHRIVLSASYSRVFVAVDGQNAFQILQKNSMKSIQSTKLLYGFLSNNFTFTIGQIFEGLIGDIQILNPENYTDYDLLKLSTYSVSSENRIPNSVASFQPYMNEKGELLFLDARYQKFQYFYEGRICLDKCNLFKQLSENDLILCIFSNLNDSQILKKALKILLRLLSIEKGSDRIEKLIFPDNDSFLRFVFLLNNQINLFNERLFELVYQLFESIRNIQLKQIFVSEFLFNLSIWQTNFILIYNRLIMNILPTLIQKSNLNINTIFSVSTFSILNSIEKEESDFKKSILFELLFSFIYKYLILQNDKEKIEKVTQINSIQILNGIQNILNESYCVQPNLLNLSMFDEKLDLNHSEIVINRVLTEIIQYVENGNEKTVVSFALRLFGLIPTQADTKAILEMMGSNCKSIVFKRFLDVFFSATSKNNFVFDVDLNSFYKLASFISQNVNNQYNSIDILLAVLISSSQLMKKIDFDTNFEIYQSISNISIKTQNESCQIFFLFWTIIILSISNNNENVDQNDIFDKIINLFIDSGSKELISSFVWLFYLFCLNSNILDFKKWELFIDKLINEVISSLKSLINHQKDGNFLIQVFIDIIITISLITQNNKNNNVNDNDNEVSILYLMDLVRGEESFKIFNSFSLDKILKGVTCYMKNILEFCSVIEESDKIAYSSDLIVFILTLVCSESETSHFVSLFVRTSQKMGLDKSNIECVADLFSQISVPRELLDEMVKSFPDFPAEEKAGSSSQNIRCNSADGEKIEKNQSEDGLSTHTSTAKDEAEYSGETNGNRELSTQANEGKSEGGKKAEENGNSDETNENRELSTQANACKSEGGKKAEENGNSSISNERAEQRITSETAINESIASQNAASNGSTQFSGPNLVQDLIVRILASLLRNVSTVSIHYVKFGPCRSSFDCDATLRHLCNIERSRHYLRLFQLQALQMPGQEEAAKEGDFIVFSPNYVPILATSKNPFIDVIEIENGFVNNSKSGTDQSTILMEEVLLHFQGTKKKCHIFYDVENLGSFIIGGIEIQKQNVNFIVKHSKSSIEIFLNNGFQFIIEFATSEEETHLMMHSLFGSFNELSLSIISQKISELSLNLIEIILLLNFLNGRSFNMTQNLPVIKDMPASQFILENHRWLNDESIENWANDFFKVGTTIKFDSILKKGKGKASGTDRCIGVLTSPVVFFSTCRKKVFCVDKENMMRGASIILPPRVPRATIQIFNSNYLFAPISEEIGANRKHLQISSSKDSPSDHCTAFDIIKNNFLNTSENINHINEFFIAASFNEYSGIFIYLVKMSELSFLKSFNLNENVKYIIGSQNCFVFIANNSNKVHIIKLNSNVNDSYSIDHRYFVSHSSDISIIAVSKNFIVSIDSTKKVCLTLIDSLQTVKSFSIENIPIIAHISNSPSFRIIALLNYKNDDGKKENKVVSIDFNGKVIWEYKKNDDQEKITNFILLRDKVDNNSCVLISLIINDKKVECRRLNEIQLFEIKKPENNSTLIIDNDDFELLLDSVSAYKISFIKYDDELDFVGYIDAKNNLNGLFLEYM